MKHCSRAAEFTQKCSNLNLLPLALISVRSHNGLSLCEEGMRDAKISVLDPKPQYQKTGSFKSVNNWKLFLRFSSVHFVPFLRRRRATASSWSEPVSLKLSYVAASSSGTRPAFSMSLIWGRKA